MLATVKTNRAREVERTSMGAEGKQVAIEWYQDPCLASSVYSIVWKAPGPAVRAHKEPHLDVTDRIIDPESLVDVTEPPVEERPVDVTRYLAAATYLDEDFRDDVIVQTLRERYRFIGPAYGVDIASVVRHALASRWLSRRRDLILTALIVIGVWALHLPLLFGVGVFVGGVLVAAALTSPRTKLRWKILLSVVAYIGITAFALHPLSLLTAVAAIFVVASDLYTRRYRVAARRMNSKDFNPDAPAYGRERPGQRAADARRIAHLAGHRDGNIVVYSGYAPFKGSGVEAPRWSWSFAVNVTTPADGPSSTGLVEPFEATEIHDHVVEAMTNLKLEGLTVADRFYASGRHIIAWPDVFFYPRQRGDPFPRLRYQITDVAALEDKPEALVRHYIDLKVAIWQSELILSIFVRFTRVSDYLFAEATYYLLPPIKGSYYGINALNPRPTPHEFFRLVLTSIARTPVLWLEAPIQVAKWMARPIARARREQQVGQAIRENRKFDYGAIGSIRESGSEREYAKFFQKMDMERVHKVIDRHLLASVVGFLQEKGVDTAELEQNVRLIINRGFWPGGMQTPTASGGGVVIDPGRRIP
jgi:hypothetical protein